MKKYVRLISVFLFAVMLLGLCACSQEQGLLGKWLWVPDEDSDGYQMVYEFRDDGTVIVTDNTEGSVPQSYPFSYTETTLSITYSDETDEVMTYSYFVEGDSLTMAYSEGAYSMTRVK